MPFISIGEWGPDCQTMNLVVTVLDAEVKCVESHDIHLRYSRLYLFSGKEGYVPKKPPVPVVPDRFRGQGPVSQKGDTWLEGEVDDTRRAYVRFPDGKLRLVRCGGTADTFFSIPVRGHDGYVTSKETTWAPESEFVFQPHIKSVAKYGDWPA